MADINKILARDRLTENEISYETGENKLRIRVNRTVKLSQVKVSYWATRGSKLVTHRLRSTNGLGLRGDGVRTD